MILYIALLFFFLLSPNENSPVRLVVLGNVQDGGSPHIGCKKACCKRLFEHPDIDRQVVSLGLIDTENKDKYLFEATPDLPRQMKSLKSLFWESEQETPDGIFLTHAHIGHYAGLIYLGKEALAAKKVPIYAMPKMREFLENNGPWSQLVSQENIELKPIEANKALRLNPNIQVVPFLVPHRDEYSETVGFKIIGPNRSALFIPDIDKWEKWERDIVEEIAKVDYAFIDATFFDAAELNHRDISQIPHPFVVESMERFKDLANKEKAKVYFIHFNHTNRLLDRNSMQSRYVKDQGFRIARFQDRFEM